MSATKTRIQYVTTVNPVQVDPSTYEDQQVVHYAIPVIQETGSPGIEIASDIASNKWLLKGGEVLVSKLNVHKNCVTIVGSHAGETILASTEFVAFTPVSIEQRFLKYIFQSEETIQQLSSFSESATRSHARVNPSDIIKYKAYQPPLDTQRLIADYLDRETARIDALVAEKEKMLALLEEKRAALISRAVTRGLDPTAPLKPSGLDWLGDIPAHWETRTLKKVSLRIDTGSTPSASYMDGTLQPEFLWFTPGDFENGGELIDSKRKIPLEAIEDKEAKVFPANAIMVIGIGATLGKVASSPVEFSANQQINVIYPSKETFSEFLLYVLQGYEKVFRANANSATLPILNQERLGAIHIPFPPMEEQLLIAAKIREKKTAERKILEQLISSISLLKERRAALITAAVTGQIPLEAMRP